MRRIVLLNGSLLRNHWYEIIRQEYSSSYLAWEDLAETHYRTTVDSVSVTYRKSGRMVVEIFSSWPVWKRIDGDWAMEFDKANRP